MVDGESKELHKSPLNISTLHNMYEIDITYSLNFTKHVANMDISRHILGPRKKIARYFPLFSAL
jgi:hypothetical protein